MKSIAKIFLITFMSFVSYAHATEMAVMEQSAIKPASAVGANSFEECAALTMWLYAGGRVNDMVDAADPNRPAPAKKKWLPFGNSDSSTEKIPTVKIPKGWSVVGTGWSHNNEPLLFICH